MKITIESTPQIVEINGGLVRVWDGVTESGRKCYVFVHTIAVHESEDATEFDREVEEQLDARRRANLLMQHLLKTWDPPLQGVGTAVMQTIAFLFGREALPADLTDAQERAITEGVALLIRELLSDTSTTGLWPLAPDP
jgi:hypothetical protein